MRKLFIIPFLGLSLCFGAAAQSQKVTFTELWESDTTLRTPECVLFEPKENVLYVACINGGPSAENKGSYISKVGLDGKVIKLKFTDNLNSTKGMGILGKNLYVTEMANVVEIELASGKVLNRFPVEGAKFLNDIAVDEKNGVIYVTDSQDHKIYSITKGKVELVLSGAPLQGANGLLMENNQLLIGNGDGSLLSMNPANKKVSTIAKGMGGIDGIVALGGKKYVVSEWSGKIWYIDSNGTPELKVNTVEEKINTADIGYNPKSKTLYVPTFFHNTVKAYSVK